MCRPNYEPHLCDLARALARARAREHGKLEAANLRAPMAGKSLIGGHGDSGGSTLSLRCRLSLDESRVMLTPAAAATAAATAAVAAARAQAQRRNVSGLKVAMNTASFNKKVKLESFKESTLCDLFAESLAD